MGVLDHADKNNIINSPFQLHLPPIFDPEKIEEVHKVLSTNYS